MASEQGNSALNAIFKNPNYAQLVTHEQSTLLYTHGQVVERVMQVGEGGEVDIFVAPTAMIPSLTARQGSILGLDYTDPPGQYAFRGFTHNKTTISSIPVEVFDALLTQDASLARSVIGLQQRTKKQLAQVLADATKVNSLTEREMEILQLMENGLSNEELGISLGIKTSTVKAHIQSIFSKLGVRKRGRAVAVLSRVGVEELSI